MSASKTTRENGSTCIYSIDKGSYVNKLLHLAFQWTTVNCKSNTKQERNVKHLPRIKLKTTQLTSCISEPNENKHASKSKTALLDDFNIPVPILQLAASTVPGQWRGKATSWEDVLQFCLS